MKVTKAGNLKISKREFMQANAEVAADLIMRVFKKSKSAIEAFAFTEELAIFSTELTSKLFNDKEE